MDKFNRKEDCQENGMEIGVDKTGNNKEDVDLDSFLTLAESPEVQNLSLDQGRSLKMEEFSEMGVMSSNLVDLSQFHILPIEVKHEVLKRFPIETKKAARLVSKEWEVMLRDHVKFTPILTIETCSQVTSSKQKLQKMTVSGVVFISKIVGFMSIFFPPADWGYRIGRAIGLVLKAEMDRLLGSGSSDGDEDESEDVVRGDDAV